MLCMALLWSKLKGIIRNKWIEESKYNMGNTLSALGGNPQWHHGSATDVIGQGNTPQYLRGVYWALKALLDFMCEIF